MIYGIIGDNWEGTVAKQFVRDFKRLEETNSRIDVHINGPGGSLWDGLPIFNVIKASKKETHTYVDGIAFSMSAMIALAGDVVHMAKGSLLMLHNVSGMAWGNSKVLRDQADVIDKYDVVLCSLIAEKTGKTDAEVMSAWMNYEDHHFTPDEALAAKLIDTIENYDAKDMPADAKNMSPMQVAAYYNEQSEEPSESLITKVAAQIKNLFPNQTPINTDMKLVLALKGVAKPTAEQIDLANGELTTEGITNVTLVEESFITDAAAASAEVARLTAELVAATEGLATVNTAMDVLGITAAASATQVTALTAQLAALPGATHTSKTGEDTPPADEVDDTETILANLPHNRHADKVLGY